MSWDDIKDQLERYYSEPHESLLEVLALVTNLNDDLYHGRSKSCIHTCVHDIKAALDRIKESA